MNNYLLLAICLLSGILLKRNDTIPKDSYKLLSKIVINLALPSLGIISLLKLQLNKDLWLAVAMPWITFILSVSFFFWLGKLKHWTKADSGVLALTAGLANTSFVGIPLLTSILGLDSIPIAILIDQAGTFLVMSVLGLSVATYAKGQFQFSIKQSIKKTITFPPFIALVIGLTFSTLNLQLPNYLENLMTALSKLTIPLAVICVGMQLSIEGAKDQIGKLTWGLGFKLVLMPLLFFGLCFFLYPHFDLKNKVIILESAMGPSIAAGMIATEHELNNKLTSLMLGIGIVTCTITVPLICLFLAW